MDEDNRDSNTEEKVNEVVEQPEEVAPQPAVEEHVEKVSTPKNKKIMMIVIAAVVAALLGAAAFAFLGSDSSDTEEENQNALVEQNEEQPAPEEAKDEMLRLTTIAGVYESDESGLQSTLKLKEGEQYRFSNSDSSIHYFVKLGDVTNEFGTYEDVVSFWKLENGERTEVVKSVVDSKRLSFRSLSPNGEEVFVMVSAESGFGDYAIGTVNVASGKLTVWYEQTENDDPLLTDSQWLDDDTLIIRESSCLQCDGPSIARLWIAERGSDPEMLIDLTKPSNDNYGDQSFVDTENRKVYFSVTNIPALGLSAEFVNTKSISEIHVINPDTKDTDLLARVKNMNLSLFGLSTEGKYVVVTSGKAVKGEDYDELATPTLGLIDTSTGNLSDIPLELRQLENENTNYNSVDYSDSTSILFFTLGDYSGNNPKISGYSLNISDGEAPVESLFTKTFAESEWVRFVEII